jgi:hypothetical protein
MSTGTWTSMVSMICTMGCSSAESSFVFFHSA